MRAVRGGGSPIRARRPRPARRGSITARSRGRAAQTVALLATDRELAQAPRCSPARGRAATRQRRRPARRSTTDAIPVDEPDSRHRRQGSRSETSWIVAARPASGAREDRERQVPAPIQPEREAELRAGSLDESRDQRIAAIDRAEEDGDGRGNEAAEERRARAPHDQADEDRGQQPDAVEDRLGRREERRRRAWSRRPAHSTPGTRRRRPPRRPRRRRCRPCASRGRGRARRWS